MDQRVYIQPIGLIHGPAAHRAIAARAAYALAGRNDIAFTHVSLYEGDEGPGMARIYAVSELANSREPAIERVIARLQAPRPAFGQLNFDRPHVMGILNVTPDSFSDGGRYTDHAHAIEHGRKMAAQGAELIDIGGESTRPGAEPVSADVELERVLPTVRTLSQEGILVSVDTSKAEVMQGVSAAGARIINDVTALQASTKSATTASNSGCAVILMHMSGEPRTMQHDPYYGDVVAEVYDALSNAVDQAENAGISRSRLIIDPGFGFGKTVEHNLQLLTHLSIFHGLGLPMLIGASRKSFIGAVSEGAPVDQRLSGSLAVALHAAAQGAQIVRVHDVVETRQALTLAWRGAGNH